MKTGNKKSKHPIVKITLLSIIVIVIIAGIKECWLDFNQIPKETELAKQESEGEKNENRSVSRCTWGHSERDMHSICDCIRLVIGNTGHRKKHMME